MREIKFRGMSLNGWVYGHYVVLVDSFGEPVDCIWETGASRGTPVDRKSVGQFTGLEDKNGTEIYEGDVLKICNSGLRCQIIYGAPSFCRKWIDKVSMRHRNLMEPMTWNTHIIYEVIGNIHEHKHLLEE